MSSQHLSRLRVNVFPGGFNWPIFVAIEMGWFAREGVAVELQATTGSIAQMTDLAAGNFEIAMTAFDNVVAYVEGQGEAPIGVQSEFFAFLGSDDSFLSLVAQPDISCPADLRGRAVSVDATTTGYAFALFDMLDQAGLKENDYVAVRVGGMAQRFDDLCRGHSAATLLSAPYDLLARRAGLRVLARVEGPYQGNVGATRRGWARSNPNLVIAYIRLYLEAVRWLYEPANTSEACDILERNVAAMTPELAAASYPILLDPSGGFFRDGRVQEKGVRRVLCLRSRYAAERRNLSDPSRYVDHHYWELAQGGTAGKHEALHGMGEAKPPKGS
jgi:ABC-type nitrate/sulfonate/bicarbonate transport system substrate-binding protein